MTKVFLGGTRNNSTWREELIKKLKIGYFSPIAEYWNKEAQYKEIRQRKECDFILYVITPKMQGSYSIAKVVDDSNKRPEETLLLILESDENDVFTIGETRSLQMVSKMIEHNGSKVFLDLKGVANFLNKRK